MTERLWTQAEIQEAFERARTATQDQPFTSADIGSLAYCYVQGYLKVNQPVPSEWGKVTQAEVA